MEPVKTAEPRAPSSEWEELRGRVRHRAAEALDLITILLQDAVILLAGFLAEFAYEHWLHSSHPFFQLAISLSSALFLLLYGITATVHIVHYVRGQFGTTSAGVLGQWLPWALAALGVIAAAVAVTVPLGHASDQRAPELALRRVSFDIAVPSAPAPNQVTISPDGKYMGAMVTSDKGNVIWLRALAGLNAQTVNGSEGASSPFWSPDSRFLAFFASGKLKKVDLSGAPPQTLCDCDVTASARGGTWNRNGVIVFGPTDGPLFRVSASGGAAVQLTELDASRRETAHRHPYLLPDGQHFLFTVVSSNRENSGIYVGSLDSKERKRILASALKAAFAPPDHVLFVQHEAVGALAANAAVLAGTLMAQQWDAKRLEIVGEPVPIAGVGGNFSNSNAGFAVSDDGVLAYRVANRSDRVMQWYDRTGKPIGIVDVPGAWESPVVSPDLQRLAVLKRDGAAGDLWILDQARGTNTRFTFNPAFDDAPLWSPDGTRIVFSSDRNGTSDLYQKNSAGTGQEELLLKSDHAKIPDDWSADGRFLLYRDLDPKTGWDLWALPLTGDKKPQAVLATPFNEIQGRFSPDGRWMAYVSNESGTDQVYVQSFPSSGSKWQISIGAGGYQPRWRRDGKELFFMTGGTGINVRQDVMAVAVDTSNAGVFRAGVPQKLFAVIPHLITIPRNSWEVTPDGQRFLVVVNPTLTVPPPVTVVVNWLQGPNVLPR